MNDSFRRLPPLNALRAFEASSRHLSFRLAADELGVTQGAVAQQVRGLEAALGLKLFERHPRALALTASGAQYKSSVRRAFELLADATDALKPQPLTLTLSVTPTFAAKWLLARLPDFTQAHPDIDLRVLATERLSHFQNDNVDLAVRYGRPPFGAGLNAELLFEDEIVAVASPSLLKKTRLASNPASLSRFPILHDAHDLWPRFIESLEPRPTQDAAKHIRFNQTALAIDAAIAGQGVALAHAAFVHADLAAGRLVRALPIELRTGAGFYLVSQRKPKPASVLAVQRWMRRQAQRR
jgi:LysR family transcriptional regulator, glycine cleavage system transcriptional activator